MLVFEDSFYDGEWRGDFFVAGEMKRAWAAQMELLMEIDRICKKHDIQYYADAGTLLGAIRHKGFIPWDDDLDIAMKRKDYERFFVVAKEELPRSYKIGNIHNNVGWEEPFMRIINGDKVNFTKGHLERWHRCPWVIGVDIFPIDHLPDNLEERELMIDLYMLIRTVASHIKEGIDTPEVWEGVAGIEELCHVKLEKSNIISELLHLADKILRLYEKDEVKDMSILVYMGANRSNIYKREWYEQVVDMPFENITLPVPIGYDEILKAKYGDYSVPVREELHAYPFYAEQKKQWEEHLLNKQKAEYSE
ncbi:LicD family protein [Kineothrix sp. MB12-C1]|uniref:LicD family protein n=1 Tax=Kineothrix sp. MB12-C1 TaxID=3070215 RepID=UPI0027D2B38B|nr:LicD family protein [Kineothrix sp. MB12-C1]WMC93881.1 LicD family protein [Kineothrix sp. MB12-C1]